MRLPKRYLIRVVKKRLIELFLMFSVISIVLLGVYMAGARSGTGILCQLGYDNYDLWYIHSNNGLLEIRNSHSFSHVLIPENIGKEVHYIINDANGYTSGFGLPVYVFTLDLVPVFINKQFILYICIAMSSIVVFTYLYLNRKKFPLTNRLLG